MGEPEAIGFPPQNVVNSGRNSPKVMGNEQSRKQLMKRTWFEFIRKKYHALGSQRRLVHQEEECLSDETCKAGEQQEIVHTSRTTQANR